VTLGVTTLTLAAVTGWLVVGYSASAQETLPGSALDSAAPPASNEPAPVIPAPVAAPLNDQRILKVIPDYQTIEDSTRPVAPMTPREKWNLGLKESVDPFNIANAALTAAFSQHDNQTPKYGEGWPNYGRRFGAAIADFGTQNFFSAGVFANLLHQDPRYFRKGPSSKIAPRVWYSVTRLFVCRGDNGNPQLNATNLLGMAFGIAASNVYYPSASRTGTVMAGRLETSFLGGVTGNLMSEFWPDVQKKFFRKKPKN
jgi:hypothetical protein